MSESQYEVELVLQASVHVPHGKTGTGSPPQTWTMQVGSLGGFEVDPAELLKHQDVCIQGLEVDDFKSMVENALARAIEVVVNVDTGNLTLDGMIESAREKGFSFEVKGDFDNDTLGRLMDKGLMPALGPSPDGPWRSSHGS